MHIALLVGVTDHVALGRAGTAERIVAARLVRRDLEQRGAGLRAQDRARRQVDVLLRDDCRDRTVMV